MGSSDTTIWVVVARRSGAGRRRALKALVAAGVVTCGAHEDRNAVAAEASATTKQADRMIC